MKILQVNDFLEQIGGAERVVDATIDLLEEHGHTVRLYAPSTRSILGSVFSIRHYSAIRNLIQEFKPDILHVHGIYRNVSPSVLLAARSMKVPVVMSLHDFHLVCPKTSLVDDRLLNCSSGLSYRCLLLDCHPRTRFSRIYQTLKMLKLSFHRFIIRSTVHQFLPASVSLMNWTKKNFGVTTITLLPYMLLTEHEESPQPPRTKTILYIGRLIEQKGVDILVQAAAKVCSVFPDVNLKIVGIGDYEQKLKELTENLHISDNITFAGKIPYEQLLQEYDDAYCVIIPSKYVENCPIVGIEAISKGKVVIASMIGGLPDIIADNETGFLVQPGDIDGLAEKIIYVMKNPEILPKMGARARIKFFQTFSKPVHYRTLLSVYNKVIHEASSCNSQF